MADFYEFLGAVNLFCKKNGPNVEEWSIIIPAWTEFIYLLHDMYLSIGGGMLKAPENRNTQVQLPQFICTASVNVLDYIHYCCWPSYHVYSVQREPKSRRSSPSSVGHRLHQRAAAFSIHLHQWKKLISSSRKLLPQKRWRIKQGGQRWWMLVMQRHVNLWSRALHLSRFWISSLIKRCPECSLCRCLRSSWRQLSQSTKIRFNAAALQWTPKVRHFLLHHLSPALWTSHWPGCVTCCRWGSSPGTWVLVRWLPTMLMLLFSDSTVSFLYICLNLSAELGILGRSVSIATREHYSCY